jgi:hypothetical protein
MIDASGATYSVIDSILAFFGGFGDNATGVRRKFLAESI